MELFGAADEEQFTYIKQVIDECDYYILVIAGRYGSVASDGISYTEKEFSYAASKGKTVLAFICEDRLQLPAGKVDADPSKLKSLDAFIAKVKEGRIVSFWGSVSDLKAAAIISLTKAFSQKPGVGWIRADMSDREELLDRINELTKDLDKVRAEKDALVGSLDLRIEDIASLDDKYDVTCQYRMYSGGDGQLSLNLEWGRYSFLSRPSFLRPPEPE